MWPMGFISLSSSMRKAEEAKKSIKSKFMFVSTSLSSCCFRECENL